jgi:hypothetical protein
LEVCVQKEPTQGKPTQGRGAPEPPGPDGPCNEPDSADTAKRAGVYGLEANQLLEESIVVGPGTHVRLSGAGYKGNDAGLVHLQPTNIDDVKRWIGVPDHVGARRACCGPALSSIPGVESPSDFRKLAPEDRLAVRALANEYVHGDSGRVARYKALLNQLIDRAVITGVFLRQDIDIHRGAVLELGKDVKVLFARHIRIYRGGLLKLTGDAKIDCVTLTGNLLEIVGTTTVAAIPAFGQLVAAEVTHD